MNANVVKNTPVSVPPMMVWITGSPDDIATATTTETTNEIAMRRAKVTVFICFIPLKD
jgi:hypothetical protein